MEIRDEVFLHEAIVHLLEDSDRLWAMRDEKTERLGGEQEGVVAPVGGGGCVEGAQALALARKELDLEVWSILKLVRDNGVGNLKDSDFERLRGLCKYERGEGSKAHFVRCLEEVGFGRGVCVEKDKAAEESARLSRISELLNEASQLCLSPVCDCAVGLTAGQWKQLYSLSWRLMGESAVLKEWSEGNLHRSLGG